MVSQRPRDARAAYSALIASRVARRLRVIALEPQQSEGKRNRKMQERGKTARALFPVRRSVVRNKVHRDPIHTGFQYRRRNARAISQ